MSRRASSRRTMGSSGSFKSAAWSSSNARYLSMPLYLPWGNSRIVLVTMSASAWEGSSSWLGAGKNASRSSALCLPMARSSSSSRLFSRALSAMAFTTPCQLGRPRSTIPRRRAYAFISRTRSMGRTWSSAWLKNRAPSSMLITFDCGDRPSSNAKRLRRRSQTPCTVPISDSAVRSARSRRSLASRRSRTRSRSSVAALTVNVVASIPAGGMPSSTMAFSSSSISR